MDFKIWLRKGPLSPLAPDPASELNIFRHNGDPLGVNGAKVSVLKETNQVSLSSFLKRSHGATLEPKISLEILSDFSDKPLEWKLSDLKLSTLLVLPDLSQRHCSWPETMRLLHSSGGRSWFPRRLCSQLLPWCLSSGWFPSSLLGTSHFGEEIERVKVFVCLFPEKMREMNRVMVRKVGRFG